MQFLQPFVHLRILQLACRPWRCGPSTRRPPAPPPWPTAVITVAATAAKDVAPDLMPPAAGRKSRVKLALALVASFVLGSHDFTLGLIEYVVLGLPPAGPWGTWSSAR